jgi:tetratricopeptide (TPR) repeat protein
MCSLRILLMMLPLGLAAGPRAFAHDSPAVPIAALTRQIRTHPDSLPLYLARGELRRVFGDFAGARADYDHVERHDPEHPGLGICRAALALDTGDPAGARRWLDHVLGVRPADPAALRLRSQACATLGDRRGAIADLGTAISGLEHPHPDLYLERARLQMAEGDAAAALAGLDAARLQLGPVASLEVYAIELELAAGRPGAARDRLEALRGSSADPAPFLELSARIAAGGGSAGSGAGSGRAEGPAPRPMPRPEAITATAAPSAALLEGGKSPAVEVRSQRGSDSEAIGGPDVIDATQAVLTRGAYLQMGTATAITVRWRTDVATNTWVRYGTVPGSLTSSASNGTLTTEHEIRVTGLLPETRYYYSVGTSSGALAGDASYTFRTAPTPGSIRPMRIWVIGDSGEPGAAANAVRDAYAAWTGTRKTDFWLMLGDNAYSNGTDSEYQAAVFNQYPTMLRQSVMWPTRGNHELLYSGSNNDYYEFFTMPDAAQAGGLSSGTEAYYSFDWANIHFICLDSEGSSLAPGSAMLTWLAGDIAASHRTWVIAFWHHPPYSKGSHDSDDATDSGGRMRDMRVNVLPILEAAGVDLVLTGHSHSYERSYLLNGHYGLSSTLTAAMKLDDGDGRVSGDGAYAKPAGEPTANKGEVFAVAGSGSRLESGNLNHPAMVTSLYQFGSMVLDVDGNRLDARFLSDTGAELDNFTILKGSGVDVGPGPVQAGGLQLGPGMPNPFSLDTRLSFTLPRAGRIRLTLLDPAGRRVATLADGWHEAGVHGARWDGRDVRGRLLPTGVYLVVLEADGTRVSRKIAHVR